MILRRSVFCVLLAASLLAGCRAAGGEPYPPTRLAAEGTPEEIGRRVGREQAEAIRKLHPVMLLAARSLTLHSKETLYKRAGQLAAKLSEEDLAEIKGLAAGSGLSCEDALFLNLFYSLTTDWPACRGLAAWGGSTTDGELLHARNLDWLDYPGKPLQRFNLILNVKPKDGIEHLLLTWPGFQGALTGTNRKGLTLAFNQLPGAWPAGEPLSEPIFFTLRRALRKCSTIDEAVKLIRETKPLGNGSVLISEAGAKTAVVVEVIGGKVGLRRPDGEMIANANHPTREAGWTGIRTGPAGAPALDVARGLDGKLSAERIRQVMADRKVMQEINLLAVVFEPAKNRMHLACGEQPAAAGKFTEYALFPEEKK